MSDSLSCTNADLWTATQLAPGETRAPLAALLKVPTNVLAVRNGSALGRAVEDRLKDIDAARIALCEQHGTKTEDGNGYTITDVPAFQKGWDELMAESVTLPGVRALKVSEFKPDAFVSPDDVRRCGALVAD